MHGLRLHGVLAYMTLRLKLFVLEPPADLETRLPGRIALAQRDVCEIHQLNQRYLTAVHFSLYILSTSPARPPTYACLKHQSLRRMLDTAYSTFPGRA